MKIAVIVGLLLLTACQTTQQAEERVATFFTEVTFGDNSAMISDLELSNDYLIRWEKDPTVGLTGSPTAEQRRETETAVARIRRATAQNLALVEGEGDITVEFSDRMNFVIRGNITADCYTHITGGRAGLKKVDIKVGSRRQDSDRGCLDHEFMHAFGFTGHSHRLRSVMSDSHNEIELTEWDLLAYRILYSSGVKSGMTWNDVSPIAAPMISEVFE